MKRFLFVLLSFECSLNSYAQLTFQKPVLSKKATTCVARIEKRNEFLDGTVYLIDYTDSLSKYATQSELLALTRHQNGVVRSHAFAALCYDSTVALLPFVVQHISDTNQIATQYGCIRGKRQVGDMFITLASEQDRLTATEQKYIDSLLIYTPNNLSARYSAIDSAALTATLYPRMRELVINEQYSPALLKLAAYQREEDIPLILGFHAKNTTRKDDLFYIYNSISLFSHAAFFPFLKHAIGDEKDSTHYDARWCELYAAVASYRNNTALALLQQQMLPDNNPMREYYMHYLFSAALSFYTPLYDTLLWHLWANEKKINTEAFYLLYSQNPNRTLELTQQTLQQYDEHHFGLEFSYSKADADARLQSMYPGSITLTSLLEKMLDTLIVHNRQQAVYIIDKNLKTASIHSFSIFLKSAQKLDIQLFSSTITKRLAREDYTEIFGDAIKALMPCKNTAICTQLTTAWRQNRKLQGNDKKYIASLLKAGGVAL